MIVKPGPGVADQTRRSLSLSASFSHASRSFEPVRGCSASLLRERRKASASPPLRSAASFLRVNALGSSVAGLGLLVPRFGFGRSGYNVSSESETRRASSCDELRSCAVEECGDFILREYPRQIHI